MSRELTYLFSHNYEKSNASLLGSEEACLEEKNENLQTGIVDFQILWKVAEGLITDYIIFIFITGTHCIIAVKEVVRIR